MEASVNVEKSNRLTSKEVAGKKRTVVTSTPELPKKVSMPSVKSPSLGPAVVSPTTTDSYKFNSPRLMTVGSPVTLFVVGEPPRFPFNVGGPHFMIPPPTTVDTNANNNGVHLLLSPPITTMPTSVTQPVNSVTTKDAKLCLSSENDDVVKSLKEFQECPLDVEEHFRRSLAHVPGYKEFADKSDTTKNTKSNSGSPDQKEKCSFTDFQHSDIMSAPESVDDHFARALGKEWTKLAKLKENGSHD